jgi:hypothetical protein
LDNDIIHKEHIEQTLRDISSVGEKFTGNFFTEMLFLEDCMRNFPNFAYHSLFYHGKKELIASMASGRSTQNAGCCGYSRDSGFGFGF